MRGGRRGGRDPRLYHRSPLYHRSRRRAARAAVPPEPCTIATARPAPATKPRKRGRGGRERERETRATTECTTIRANALYLLIVYDFATRFIVMRTKTNHPGSLLFHTSKCNPRALTPGWRRRRGGRSNTHGLRWRPAWPRPAWEVPWNEGGSETREKVVGDPSVSSLISLSRSLSSSLLHELLSSHSDDLRNGLGKRWAGAGGGGGVGEGKKKKTTAAGFEPALTK